MRRYRTLASLVAGTLLAPAAAMAIQPWAWPLGSSVSLSYGAEYVGPDGGRRTHGGIDIAAEAGARVGSVAAGSVVFAGPVPAGEGRRITAVTVATDDGLRVTYLPLDRSPVHKGTRVGPGDEIGRLAESGDASAAGVHLHLGVKRGDRQLDPVALLGAAPLVAGSVPAVRPAAPKAPPRGPEPGLPVRAAPPAGGRGTVSRPVPASDASRARVERLTVPRAIPGPAAVTMQGAVGVATRVVRTPTPRRIPALPVAPPARIVPLLAAVGRARSGVAWVLVRLLVAGLGFLCLRPVLRALRVAPVAPGGLAVRRVRT